MEGEPKMTDGLHRIEHNGQLLAMILSTRFDQDGTHFFTDDEDSMQLSFQRRPTGQQVPAHAHNRAKREIWDTQEVLWFKKGRARFDFYDDDGTYLESRIIGAGDVILLARGGHGYEVLSDVELVEAKQGPYLGNADKRMLTAVSSDKIKVKSGE
jgi:hypothetical protein